jgi:hypothetical protein
MPLQLGSACLSFYDGEFGLDRREPGFPQLREQFGGRSCDRAARMCAFTARTHATRPRSIDIANLIPGREPDKSTAVVSSRAPTLRTPVRGD